MSDLDPELSAVVEDESLGAGNFLYKLADSSCADRCTVFLDESLQCDSGTIPAVLKVKDLVPMADSIANWYAEQGVEPKDPVALIFDDNVFYLLHYLALTRLGAIAVLVNGGLTDDNAIAYVRRVGAELVVTERHRQQSLRSALDGQGNQPRICCAQAVPLTSPGDYQAHQHQPLDPVLIAHSSGTTGIPKAIQHTHHGFAYGIKQQLPRMFGDRVLTAMPHAHAASVTVLIGAILRGCQIKLQSRKDPDSVLASIAEFRPDFFCSFPTVYMDLCRQDLQPHDLSSIRCWLSTGDANHESHIRTLMQQGSHERDGTRHPGSYFLDNLGFTEFAFSVFRRVYRPGQEVRFDRCVGRPFPWIEVAILDDRGNQLGPDQIGKLGVRAPCVTPGYWNDSRLTVKNTLGGYWLTGDLVYRTEEGDYYHVDRIQDAIDLESGPFYSCQAEELILKHCGDLFDCSIVGVDGDEGTRLVMTAETVNGEQPADLKLRINALLADHHLPGVDEVLFESGRTNAGVTGKKLKFVLRQRIGQDQPA